LAITASKGSSKGAVFQFVEVHSASGTPSSDGFQFGVGSGSNVATSTLSSPTTSANDILIAFGTRGGGPSGQTFTGGGAGSWTPICVTLGAYQNETTMSAFSVTLTMTGGSGDTAMTFVAVHP
jgi:hypothetical protein